MFWWFLERRNRPWEYAFLQYFTKSQNKTKTSNPFTRLLTYHVCLFKVFKAMLLYAK